MTRYRILAWREIPTQVEATDATGTTVKRPMPRWFMQEISRITMREGLAGTDDYLDEFEWSAVAEREGTADDVVTAVSSELCARFGRTADGQRIARTEKPHGAEVAGALAPGRARDLGDGRSALDADLAARRAGRGGGARVSPEPMRVVIVGGVAGGMSAATRLRRLDEAARITVLERSGHVSFANCGLPYHVGGVIDERDALLLQTPESLAARFGIDVRVRHEAVRDRPRPTRRRRPRPRHRRRRGAPVRRARPLARRLPGPAADPRHRARAVAADVEDTDAMVGGGAGRAHGRRHRWRLHRPRDGREPRAPRPRRRRSSRRPTR